MIGNEDQDKKKNIKEKESVQEYKIFFLLWYLRKFRKKILLFWNKLNWNR